MLPTILNNIEGAGYTLSPNFNFSGEVIRVAGIIGNDILQYFNVFALEKAYVAGHLLKFLRLANGVVPYGSIDGNLEDLQKSELAKRLNLNCKPGVKENAPKICSEVNAPKKKGIERNEREGRKKS